MIVAVIANESRRVRSVHGMMSSQVIDMELADSCGGQEGGNTAVAFTSRSFQISGKEWLTGGLQRH